MKIEIGENLFYSWLRHVKDCQIVQTNWKTSPQWNLRHENAISVLYEKTSTHFEDNYHFSVFKKNASVFQVLQQTECDVLGISIQDGHSNFYTIDVAFHEGGLNYGSRDETVMKVVAKLVRTAMCLWGYLDCQSAELIFASPKINPAVLQVLLPCIKDTNAIFKECNLNFRARIIANDEFNSTVLQPILIASEGISDTSELFLRSYQLFTMFTSTEKEFFRPVPTARKAEKKSCTFAIDDQYKELKIGKIANVVVRRILESGLVPLYEIEKMQQADYSKATFDLQYPVLQKSNASFERIRYYAQPVYIHGEAYYLCSQWYETPANNDRPYLIKWLKNYQ